MSVNERYQISFGVQGDRVCDAFRVVTHIKQNKNAHDEKTVFLLQERQEERQDEVCEGSPDRFQLLGVHDCEFGAVMTRETCWIQNFDK